MRKLAVGLAAAAFVAGATPLPARTAEGECSDNEGVTVVVDFQELGGGPHARCARQPVDSGFGALQQADIGYDTTPQGFICRIAGLPAEPKGGCRVTPPASEFWAYWIAARGGQWCYANVGPGYRRPPPGSIEGWSFSKDKSASEIPKPRYSVPGPVNGQKPNPIASGDCERSSPTPTTRPPQPPGTTTPSPSGNSPPAASAGNPAPAGDSAAADRPSPASNSGDVIGSEPLPPGAATATGVDPMSPTADHPGAAIAGVAIAEPAFAPPGKPAQQQPASIDLNPPAPVSSPVGTGVAAVLVGSLASLSVWLRRRQRAA